MRVNEFVISLYFPKVIVCISVIIFDSENITDSDSKNLSEFKYTIPKTSVEGFDTTLAIALLLFPRISSPIIAFVDTIAFELN